MLDLLMQQTSFRPQEPLGRPPKSEQAVPGTQIPSSWLGAVQLSNLDSRADKSVLASSGIHLLILLENGLNA